ncbi:methyl-accepting chemotaxis protein [Butyrivibrio sp. LC3010]|uniref:methyl-accepting chemotaxis protein n=1 Tax=Butyrivibrio sp. LC3010 TaxID=1280680 RepID=UPI000414BC7E|nr:methyl-accepting chemotaxis protein [Butyrivibrio sp. LC3010]
MGKRSRIGLVGKLITIAILAVIVTAVFLFSISAFRINGTYRELIVEELHATAAHLQSQLSNEHDGDWELSSDGKLLKGGTDVMEQFEREMDELKAETGIEYTLFYGDSAIITTMTNTSGTKLKGTKVDSAALSAVRSGNNYYSTNLIIEGTQYFGYYTPMENSDGSIAGVCFTGRNAGDVSRAIIGITLVLVIISIVILVAVIIFGYVLNRRLSSKMKSLSGDLTKLADGTLSIDVDQEVKDRNDELGEIGSSMDNLIGQLGNIIGKTKNMSQELTESGTELAKNSDSASHAATQITTAVSEISKGAASQAESIQNAVGETAQMGSGIDSISESVDVLNVASSKMTENCKGTQEALNLLIDQAKKVAESVETISTTITRTDQSAKAISEFTEAINSIATQTNLLSLNASIEAARAGEAGKGFAVVASEISSLAEQSKQSADKINEITNDLMKDAGESVQVVQLLIDNIEEQGKQLDTTRDSMDKMQQGIDYVSESAEKIISDVTGLKRSKNNLDEIIQDLSAISEENAASTEETNASMEALSDTFSKISESAEGLRELAGDLTDTISYFD